MKRILSLSLLIMLFSIAAFSDIARPEKTPKPTPAPKSVESTMTIRMDPNTNVAILKIPKSKLKTLKAELEGLDDDSDNTAAATGSFSRTQTIVSGAFLSLALVFGGIWFVRSGKDATKTGKSLIVLATIGLVGSAASFVYANAGPPPAARSITSKLFNKEMFRFYNFASGKIYVEASDSTEFELRVPNPDNFGAGQE